MAVVVAVVLAATGRERAAGSASGVKVADGGGVPEPPAWLVDRPEELRQVVRAVLRRRPGPVVISTGVYGTGGFGKTTLAVVVCADRSVRHRFGEHIYWITMGRDVVGRDAVAVKANELAQVVAGQRGNLVGSEFTGDELGRVLARVPRALLVIDDVWTAEQLAPFRNGTPGWVRLITTRQPSVLADHTQRVRVDQMSEAQSRQLLTWQLTDVPDAVVTRLLAPTGRWPVLLHLINRAIKIQVETGVTSKDAAVDILRRLQGARSRWIR
jgi:hypothetical protein